MMKTVTDVIIETIIRNRISTTEVADCMNKKGAIEGVYALNKQKFAVGKVRYIYGFKNSNWEIHKQLRGVKEGEIVLVEPFESDERAVFGSLVSKFLVLYRRAAGIVVIGYMRDAHTLIKENYPIWVKGVSPLGFYNTEIDMPEDSWGTGWVIEEARKKYDGAIAVCDDSGVVIIPKEFINKEFIKKLNAIEEQEDIWFDCIDRRKWDTFDTVCLKKYQKKK
jgi:regulator of RNase E activity RraA